MYSKGYTLKSNVQHERAVEASCGRAKGSRGCSGHMWEEKLKGPFHPISDVL